MKPTEQHLHSRSELPIYYLHGWGMNSNVWEPYFQAIPTQDQESTSQLKQHIAIDLPGYGLNHQHGAKSMSIDTMADFIDGLIRSPCIIVGWSLGGLVATQLALLRPQKYQGLITIASSPCFIRGINWPGIEHRTIEMFESQLHHEYEKLMKRFVAIQTLGLNDAKKQTKLITDYLLQHEPPIPTTLNNGLQLLKNIDLRDNLSSLSVPHLSIFGRLDGLVPYRVAESIKQHRSDTRTIIINNASHAPFLSHPNQVYLQISDFVQASTT